LTQSVTWLFHWIECRKRAILHQTLPLFRCFPMMAKGNPVEIVEPNPALAGIIEAIWNWEDSGGVLPVSLPSPCPQIVLHYRTPMWSDRRC
jgi:hypothetical protein